MVPQCDRTAALAVATGTHRELLVSRNTARPRAADTTMLTPEPVVGIALVYLME